MFDMKNLAQLKRLDENNPEAMKAFWAFDKAAFEPGWCPLVVQGAELVKQSAEAGTPLAKAKHPNGARNGSSIASPVGLTLRRTALSFSISRTKRMISEIPSVSPA